MPNPIIQTWLPGCSEETLEALGLTQVDPITALLLLLHITPRPDAIARDADRLRTIILKRLDGAERMKAKALELSNMRDSFPHDEGARAWEACAREILETLDG